MKVKDMFIEFINKTESIISTMDEDMRIQWLSTKVSCSVGIILLCGYDTQFSCWSYSLCSYDSFLQYNVFLYVNYY